MTEITFKDLYDYVVVYMHEHQCDVRGKTHYIGDHKDICLYVPDNSTPDTDRAEVQIHGIPAAYFMFDYTLPYEVLIAPAKDGLMDGDICCNASFDVSLRDDHEWITMLGDKGEPVRGFLIAFLLNWKRSSASASIATTNDTGYIYVMDEARYTIKTNLSGTSQKFTVEYPVVSMSGVDFRIAHYTFTKYNDAISFMLHSHESYRVQMYGYMPHEHDRFDRDLRGFTKECMVIMDIFKNKQYSDLDENDLRSIVDSMGFLRELLDDEVFRVSEYFPNELTVNNIRNRFDTIYNFMNNEEFFNAFGAKYYKNIREYIENEKVYVDNLIGLWYSISDK